MYVLCRPAAGLGALALWMLTANAWPRDRRVVDVVEVANAQSEAKHGYDGRDVVRRVVRGIPVRQTRGWMHFTMTTFDDTQVTIACTFLRDDNSGKHAPSSFELVVEDSVIATRTVAAPAVSGAARDDEPIVFEVVVPFALTKGKTNIVVLVRARDGLTPALRELRTIQDHYELLNASDHEPRDVRRDISRLLTPSRATR